MAKHSALPPLAIEPGAPAALSLFWTCLYAPNMKTVPPIMA
jgi:hypothetical protein